jgi:hypoxanthine phosphoribosyltransferase
VNILLSEQRLREGVARLASEINDHYAGQPLTVVGVMTGSLMILADLVRQLAMPLRVGVVQARSYRGQATMPGALTIHADLLPEIAGRHVLLVDDIFDTGNTLATLLVHLQALRPASIRSLVLLRKQGRQQVEVVPDHVAFEIPDAFVVGYGLDYEDEYRNLPYVAALDAAELARGPAP